MTNRLSLGLDIGVSSVGFSVIDADEGKILELGSRLFNGTVAAGNEDRRSARQSRRLTQRKVQRRKDVARLFANHSLIENFDIENYFQAFNNGQNPYELRVNGLKQQLTKLELAQALYHLVKKRGISYDLKDAEDSDDDNGSDYQQGLTINTMQLKKMTPAEIQLERLNKFNAVRGKVVIDNEDGRTTLLNVFPTKEFVKEAKLIIQKQREFYPELLSEDFEEEYLQILQRKREYFVGPGSEKSRTDYGIYKKDGRTLSNLFEELIGKCSVYPDELRASAASYTAQYFNLLNDLNNLRILTNEDQQLTQDQKSQIIATVLDPTKKSIQMMNIIKKIVKCDKDDIKGYRIDEKEKPIFHTMAIYRKIRNSLVEAGVDFEIITPEFLDDISFTMTLNTESGEIRKRLIERQGKYDFLTDELIQIIVDNKQSFDINSNNKWHRFSLKLMRELIPEMEQRNIEQMTLINELGLRTKNDDKFLNNKYLPYREIAKEIYNPVASKSVREALKIVNAVLKKYGRIDYLVVEMPRDKNEEEEKKKIKDFQKNNKQEKDTVYTELVKVSSKSEVDDALRIYGGKLRFKMRLWYQQEGIDVYNGKKIQPIDLLRNPDSFEIDHIIPQSISFDDSINNKTLCYSEMNQIKGQKTPFEFMNEGHGQGFAKMKAMVVKNKRLKGKLKNYLFDEDINDIETRKRFIARNLVDTRYASRVILNSLQTFFKNREDGTKVTVIRGKFTSNMRKHWHLNKTRDTFHHHAIDASVIAATPFLRMWKKGTTIFPRKVEETTIDIETGEILEDKHFDETLYKEPYSGFVSELDNAWDRIKFSHQVDKKVNRKVSDSTIYSTRMGQLAKGKKLEEYIVSKIRNIYDPSEYVRFKRIYDQDKTKFLLYKIDPKSFGKLEQIMGTYPDYEEKMNRSGNVQKVAQSPFEMYRRDHGEIKKYSKKNLGPAIRKLKYLEKKLGAHIDITNKETRNKRVILRSLKPWRTDVYFNHEENTYEIMGLKYSDLKFNVNDKYGIKKSRYLEIKQKEHVSQESEFLFTLYRRDRIKVYNPETNDQIEMLFWSRKEGAKGYVFMKPVAQYDPGETELTIYGKVNSRVMKPLVPDGCKLLKVNTDILGNTFYLPKEGNYPKDILD